MTSWDDVKVPETGGGSFFKLDAGQSKVVVFDDVPPALKRLVWIDGKSEVYDSVKHAGEKISTRVCFHVYTDGKWKIWEAPPSVLGTVKKYGMKGKVGKFQFEVEREGTGLDTKWTVIQDEAIDDDLRQAMKESEKPEFKDIWTGDDDDTEGLF